jgi:hypothetical protein
LALLESQDGVDRSPEQNGRQDDGSVHYYSANRSQDHLSRHLAEVGAQFPQIMLFHRVLR